MGSNVGTGHIEGFFQNEANKLEYVTIPNNFFFSIAGTLSVKLRPFEESGVNSPFYCQEPLQRSRITLCLFVLTENSARINTQISCRAMEQKTNM